MDQSRKEWEEEVYHELIFQKDQKNPQSFTFEGEKAMALLYFADRNEANEFNEAISNRLQQLTIVRQSMIQPAHQPISNYIPTAMKLRL